MMYCFIHQIKSRQSPDWWRVNWMDYDCKNALLRFRLTPLWNNSHFVHWQFILLFTFDITWFRKVSWVMLPLHTRKRTSMYKQLKYIELVWHPSFYGHSSITTTNKAKECKCVCGCDNQNVLVSNYMCLKDTTRLKVIYVHILRAFLFLCQMVIYLFT